MGVQEIEMKDAHIHKPFTRIVSLREKERKTVRERYLMEITYHIISKAEHLRVNSKY